MSNNSLPTTPDVKKTEQQDDGFTLKHYLLFAVAFIIVTLATMTYFSFIESRATTDPQKITLLFDE